MEFSRPEHWNGQPFPSPGDLPNPGIETRSPTLQADSLPAKPQGKPENTGVGSLSLLQHIFPTQELNQGHLHYRQILYQLSYQGSPPIDLFSPELSANSTERGNITKSQSCLKIFSSFFLPKCQSRDVAVVSGHWLVFWSPFLYLSLDDRIGMYIEMGNISLLLLDFLFQICSICCHFSL